jgi:hypothetical protein
MFCSKLLFFLLLHLFLANAEPIPSLPNLRKLSFHEGYTQIFGDSNLMLHHEGKRVHISLDERTGFCSLLTLFIVEIAEPSFKRLLDNLKL